VLLEESFAGIQLENRQWVNMHILRTLCHLSCSSACAASDPDPIAFASYFTDVPEGSV